MRRFIGSLSLFRKIFLGFVSTVFLATILNFFFTAFMAKSGLMDISVQGRIRDLIEREGPRWVDFYEGGDTRELRRELRDLMIQRGITVIIQSQEGEYLLGGLHERMMSRMMNVRDHHLKDATTEIVSSSEGVRYLITVFLAPGALPPKGHMGGFLLGYVLLFFLLGGVISYLLAKHFASPIENLSRAAQTLSSGDLSVRAEDMGSFCDDEIGGLAKSFDSMAEHIEKIITGQNRLLRDISHELRSPLTRLNLSLELLKSKTGEDLNPLIGRIERESDRMNSMIGDLLSLTREEAILGRSEREPVHLKSIIERVVLDGSFEARSQGKDVILKDVVDGVYKVDNSLLSSALENLVRNSIKYTEKGTSVEVQAGEKEGFLWISVRDYGPGVNENNLDLIFNPFFREDWARDRASGGVGLGLTIAQRAIVSHGGHIEAFNRDDGFEVIIKIPVFLVK